MSRQAYIRIFFFAFLAVACAHWASAGLIYQDSFARTGDLNGSMPSPVDSGSATWTASSNKFAVSNGSVAVSAPGSGNGANAYLPLSVTAPGVYTLSATLTPTANAGDTDWLALGFTATNTNTTTGFQNVPPNPQLWVIYRENGGTQSFFGGGTGGASAGMTGTPGVADTFTLTLDSSTGAFTIADTLGLASRTGTMTLAQVGAINYVGIGAYATASGSFSNFTTSTTAPEPASLSILAVAASLGLLSRQRRRVDRTR